MSFRPALRQRSRAVADRWERFASGRGAVALMFSWAFAEATISPLIPDVLLAPLAAGNRRRFHVPLTASAAGSAAGGVLMFLFASRSPRRATTLLDRLPLVHERHVEKARRQLARRGAGAFLVQPWSGVPFKVWAVVAGSEGISPRRAIPLSIAARSARMSVFAAAAAFLAGRFARPLRDFSLVVAALYVALFVYGLRRVMR